MRCRRSSLASVKRDGSLWEMAFKRGQPDRRRSKRPAPRVAPARPSSFVRTRRFFRRWSSMPATIRERLEVVSYIHKGVRVTFENEGERTKEVFHHEEGLSDYLKKIVTERGAKPVHDVPFVQSRDSEPRLDLVLQWTEATDEHVRSYVNGIPTGSGGTHENGLRAGLGQGDAQLHRDAQPVAEGRHARGRGHPRGAVRRRQHLHSGAAVPGADQGSAEQSRADVGHRLGRASGARALAQPQPDDCRGDRRARHPGGASARGQPGRAGGGHAQDRDDRASESAGQAE